MDVALTAYKGEKSRDSRYKKSRHWFL